MGRVLKAWEQRKTNDPLPDAFGRLVGDRTNFFRRWTVKKSECKGCNFLNDGESCPKCGYWDLPISLVDAGPYCGKAHPYLAARYWRVMYHSLAKQVNSPCCVGFVAPGNPGSATFRKNLALAESQLQICLMPFGGNRKGLSVMAHARIMAQTWKLAFENRREEKS